MILTKEQTIAVVAVNSRINAFEARYGFYTKTKWWCLDCLEVIYVSYEQYGPGAIFCKKCNYKWAFRPSIVQYQYARVLKDIQLALVEKQLKNKDLLD